MASRIARFIKALTLSPLAAAKSEILILSPFGTTIVMRSYALELYLFLTADDVLPIFDTSSHFCIRHNGILCKVCQWKILYKVCYTMRAAKGVFPTAEITGEKPKEYNSNSPHRTCSRCGHSYT